LVFGFRLLFFDGYVLHLKKEYSADEADSMQR
jgi:hypothetical protein